MFTLTVILLAALVVTTLSYVASRASTFRIERAVMVEAPAQAIFPFVDDLRKWTEWSPFERLDPNLRRAYSGAATGPGAIYEWSGSGKAGAGRMEIISSLPSSAITIELEFSRPFEARNLVEFVFQPSDAGTRVSWAMHGPVPLMAKVMAPFFDMDKLVGKDFETGLATLKAVSEAAQAREQPGERPRLSSGGR